MLAPGGDRIPVELLQILTQYAICRLPAAFSLSSLEISLIPGLVGSSAAEVICSCFCSTKLWEAGEEKL